MKNRTKIAIFILISLLSFSCYKPIEFTEFESANFNFGDDEAKIEIFIKVENSNFYKINIIKTDLEVFVNDKFLGEINDEPNILIPANNSSIIEIPLNINLGSIISNAGNFMQFFSKNSNTKVRIKGTVIGKTIFGKKTIKIDQEKNISK